MNNDFMITVDGIKLSAHSGQMLIEVTDQAKIYIPRFCYHNKLTVAANCRMCLVEVENAPKPLPACATPVTKDMVVRTHSNYAKQAQKNVMELLLINHPLDCPICDQGGECELQDLAMGYGRDRSIFVERKRVVKDKNIGPLISTELTRCIHCTRCVRFGEEIAGLRELGMTGRGMHALIGTYIEKSLDHELSGNVIDLCPVGALTAKPSRYGARAWEVKQSTAIAPHDAVGSNIFIHSFRNQVHRVVPRPNETINEVWIADRDRFSYEGLAHQERASHPMVKQDGQWSDCDWSVALDLASQGLQSIVNKQGGEALGAWVSPRATVEEMFLLQGLVRHLGSNNIDHRVLQNDFRDQDNRPTAPIMGLSIADLQCQEAILLVGGNIRKEQPIIAHRLRKAAQAGAQVSTINPRDFDLRVDQQQAILVHPLEMVLELAAVAKSIGVVSKTLSRLIDSVTIKSDHQSIAQSLQNHSASVVLLGQIAEQHIDSSILFELAKLIAQASDSQLLALPAAANSVGAWQMGMVPHRGIGGSVVDNPGRHFVQMLKTPPSGLLIHNIEPDQDSADPQAALAAAKLADFVVVLTPYVNDQIKSYADVVLPIASFAETDGSYVNLEGQRQSFEAAIPAYAQSLPAWKIYRVMGQQLGMDWYTYETVPEVLDAALQALERQDDHRVGKTALAGDCLAGVYPVKRQSGLTRTGELSIYATDSLVRRAPSLQATQDGQARYVIRINQKMADHYQVADQATVRQGEHQITLPLTIDNTLANNCIWLPLIPQLGALNQEVKIYPASGLS